MSIVLLGSFFVATAVWAGAVSKATDPQTGLKAWRWEGEGLSLEIVQRLPDQTRAFFQARGFTPQNAERIAQSCVMQTIIRNNGSAPGDGVLGVDLSEWWVVDKGTRKPVKLRSHWAQKWNQSGVPKAARIAFHWALFPSQQRFEPHDYNWGMTTYGLAPGAVFDLHFVWRWNGRRYQQMFKGVECAADLTR